MSIAPPRGTQSIEGCSGQGLKVASTSAAELVDCRILRCQSCGVVSHEKSHVEMSRGMIAECGGDDIGGNGGGGAAVYAGGHLALVDVLISQCHEAGSDGGGGISVNAGTLTMSGGAFRDCEANAGFGGALRVNGASDVSLSKVTVRGCKAKSVGGIYAKAGQLSLVDVSIEECEDANIGGACALQSRGVLSAARVRVVRCGLRSRRNAGVIYVFGRSTWTDCIFADNLGGVWCEAGTHTFTRTTLLRTRSLRMPEYGSIAISAGTTTVTDSLVADTGSPCVIATEAGTLVLRNTTLRNCSAPRRELASPFLSRTFLGMSTEAATNFQSELLTLEPSCDEDPSAPLIGVNSAFTAPLNARGLRVVAPAACPSHNFTVLADHMRLLNCSDRDHVCGAAATCTDVQLMPSVPNFKTASCSCQGEVFANPNGTSLALAPYGFDPSAIGLPENLDPTSVGLPGTTIDYCVRSDTDLEPAHTNLVASQTRLGTPCHTGHATRTHGARPQCPGTASWRDSSLQDRISQRGAHTRARNSHRRHRRRSCRMGCQ